MAGGEGGLTLSKVEYMHERCDKCGKAAEYHEGWSPIGLSEIVVDIKTPMGYNNFKCSQQWCLECVQGTPAAKYLKKELSGSPEKKAQSVPPSPPTLEDMLRDFIVSVVEENQP